MESITTNGKRSTIPENQGPAAQGRAGVTAAAQDPMNGLNRAVSAETGESFSEALDESKTSRKSLYDRICNLWLIRKIRKIIGLFKKLLTCSGKDVASVSDNAGKLMNIEDFDVLADTLLCKVHALVETIEKQPTPLDQRAKSRLQLEEKLEEFSAELTQLKKNISAFKSRKSDYDSDAMTRLVEQESKIKGHIDWIKFYLEYNRKADYRDLNMNYLTFTLDKICFAAKKALKDHQTLSNEFDGFYLSATQKIREEVNKGQTSAALIAIGGFRSLARRLAISAGPDRLHVFETQEVNNDTIRFTVR